MKDEFDTLYHYTSIESLYHILGVEDDEITMRATHANFMNDPDEFEYADSIIKESLNEFEKQNNLTEEKSKSLSGKHGLVNTIGKIGGDPYILSFSEHSNDLTMWRAYGKDGNGVSIGFDFTMLQEYENQKNIENTQLVKCIYDKEIIINNMIESWKKEYHSISIENNGNSTGIGFNDFDIFFSMLEYGFSFKNEYYRAEKEWRLCKNESKNYKLGAKENLIIPYVEFKFSKEIVKKIIIGPCSNGMQVMQGLKMFLRKYGFPFDDQFIEVSQISYRQI